MIGLDTNILMRYFLRDDPEQSMRAATLMKSLSPSAPGYISSVTLAESVWVLERLYRKPKSDVVFFIRGLLESKQLSVENQDAVAQALRRFEGSNADFADCLIERLCDTAGCSHTMTFDVGATKAAGMVLL
jgi:predicted nucleic-acid-binding protein